MATENLNLEAIEPTDNMQTSLLQKMNGNFGKIDTAYGQLRDLLLARTGKNNLKDAIEYVDQLVNAQDGTITPDKVVKGYVGYRQFERIEGTAFGETTNGTSADLISGKTLYTNSGELVEGNILNKDGLNVEFVGSLNGDNYQIQIPENGYYTTETSLVRAKSDLYADLGITPMPTINVTCDASTTYIAGYGAGINKDGTMAIWAMTASTGYEHVCFYPTSIGIGTQGYGWNITAWDTGDPVGCYACTVTGLTSYSTINITLKYNTVQSTYDYVRLDVTITAS